MERRTDEGEEANAPVIRPGIVVQSADDHAFAIRETALQRGKRIRVRKRPLDIFLRFVERPGADIVALGVEYADAQGAAIRELMVVKRLLARMESIRCV